MFSVQFACQAQAVLLMHFWLCRRERHTDATDNLEKAKEVSFIPSL